jgi:hypothetical protein
MPLIVKLAHDAVVSRRVIAAFGGALNQPQVG